MVVLCFVGLTVQRERDHRPLAGAAGNGTLLPSLPQALRPPPGHPGARRSDVRHDTGPHALAMRRSDLVCAIAGGRIWPTCAERV